MGSDILQEVTKVRADTSSNLTVEICKILVPSNGKVVRIWYRTKRKIYEFSTNKKLKPYRFLYLLVNAIVDCSLPFRIVENGSFKDIITLCEERVSIKVPSRITVRFHLYIKKNESSTIWCFRGFVENKDNVRLADKPYGKHIPRYYWELFLNPAITSISVILATNM